VKLPRVLASTNYSELTAPRAAFWWKRDSGGSTTKDLKAAARFFVRLTELVVEPPKQRRGFRAYMSLVGEATSDDSSASSVAETA
jgi:hypothetical protein